MKELDESDVNRLIVQVLYEQWAAERPKALAAIERCVAVAGGRDQHPSDCPRCRADREFVVALT